MVAIAPQPNTQLFGEKRVTLHGLTWSAYRQILQALPQGRAARLTYDRGILFLAQAQQDEIEAERSFRNLVRELVSNSKQPS